MRIWQRVGTGLNRLLNLLLCLCGAVLVFWSLVSVDVAGAQWVLFILGAGCLAVGAVSWWCGAQK